MEADPPPDEPVHGHDPRLVVVSVDGAPVVRRYRLGITWDDDGCPEVTPGRDYFPPAVDPPLPVYSYDAEDDDPAPMMIGPWSGAEFVRRSPD